MGNRCFADFRRKSGDRKLRALEKTKDFSLAGRSIRAKVVEVHDGDTVRVRFLGGLFGRHENPQFRVRMSGIDAPELHPKKAGRSEAGLADERTRAAMSTDALQKMIGGKIVRVEFGENDSFGRSLGQIYSTAGGNEVDVNRWMLDNGYAVPYLP